MAPTIYLNGTVVIEQGGSLTLTNSSVIATDSINVAVGAHLVIELSTVNITGNLVLASQANLTISGEQRLKISGCFSSAADSRIIIKLPSGLPNGEQVIILGEESLSCAPPTILDIDVIVPQSGESCQRAEKATLKKLQSQLIVIINLGACTVDNEGHRLAVIMPLFTGLLALSSWRMPY
jgi:hypothetical protein